MRLWLENIVKLPQYAAMFMRHHVDGQKLPLLALDQGALLRELLGITNPEHRRMIAMQITLDVIFGHKGRP